MSKVTTTYDNTLKEKIFIIKGEEGYARSTDCILTELYTNDGERRSDWNTSLDAMKLEFRIDVLRDVGASQVVLYDNDTTIGVYDFDTNTHSIDLKYEGVDDDNRIRLSYDVEHHIYAKYMGNKQCIKSQSQSYEVKEDLPHSFKCNLVFLDPDGIEFKREYPNTHYDSYDDVMLNIRLDADSDYGNKTIKLYDNGDLIDEYVTDEDGLSENIILNDLPNGLHTLTATFDGSEYLEQKTNSVDVSVGYKVSVEECPSLIINQEPANIVAKVQDYFGDAPFFTMSPHMYSVFDEDGVKVSGEETPYDDGKIYFNDVSLSKNSFYVGFSFPSLYDYVSPEYSTNVYNDVGLLMYTNSPIISTNYTSSISCSLSQTIEGAGITVNEHKIYTDRNGVAVYNIEGSSSGDIPVTASIYGSTDTITIEDVVQYWSKSDVQLLNREWDIRSGVINSATNGWKCTPASNNYYVMNLSLCEFSHSLELIIRSASAVDYIRYCGMWVAQTSLKAGDVIRFDYNYDDEIVSFYKNNVLTSTTSIPKDTQVSWGFRATSTGYVVFDKLKLKRIE